MKSMAKKIAFSVLGCRTVILLLLVLGLGLLTGAAGSPITATAAEDDEAFPMRAVWIMGYDRNTWFQSRQIVIRNWKHVVDIVKRAGGNTIIVFPASYFGVLYRSDYLTQDRNVTGDCLAEAVAAAHAAGLKLLVALNAFGGTHYGHYTHYALAYPQMDSNGATHKTEIWVSPAAEEVRQLFVRVVEEIMTKYDVDGIVLDRVRYAGKLFGYEPVAKVGFEEFTGMKFDPWPDALLKANYAVRKQFDDWRALQVTTTVKLVSETVKQIKPDAKVYAAVFAYSPTSHLDHYQDWPTWIREGYLDGLMPMVYYPRDPVTFIQQNRAMLEKALSQANVPRRAGQYPLVGNAPDWGPDQWYECLTSVATTDAEGVGIFCYEQLGDEWNEKWEAVRRAWGSS